MGVTEQQLLELGRYETSEAFDDLERLALDLAVAKAKTPTEIILHGNACSSAKSKLTAKVSIVLGCATQTK